MKREIYFIMLLLIAIVSCKKTDTEPTIIYQDDLSVDKKTWTVDSTRVHVRKFYQGHYLISEDSIGRFEYSLAPCETINYSYSMQVEGSINLDNINLLGNIGLIFNYIDGSNYSVLEIFNNGTYRIFKRNNGVTSTIIPTTICAAIHIGSGVYNTIKIVQNNTSLELQLNNILVGRFSIPLPNAYIKVGITAGTGGTNGQFTPVTGLFNNFILIRI